MPRSRQSRTSDVEETKAREPKVFGNMPVTTAVYVVGLIHLILCVLIMSYVVVGAPLNLEGVLVSPFLQWIYGAFTLLSIVAIITGGVGALYAIEANLNVYGTILLISALIDIILFVIFLIYGQSCSTQHVSNGYHVMATVACGLRDGLTLLCLTLLVIFKFVAVFVVNRCRNYVRAASNESLIPFLKAHLASLEKAEEADFDPMPVQTMAAGNQEDSWAAWNTRGGGMPSMGPYGAM